VTGWNGPPVPIGPEALAERVVRIVHESLDASTAPAAARRLLLAVDFDGTIAPIAPSPDEASALPGALEALASLAPSVSVAIVSGRGLDDLRGRIPLAEVHLVSEHGLRWQAAHGSEAPRELALPLDTAVLDGVRAQLSTLLASQAGWLIEDKGVSLAVHHRLVASSATEPTLTSVREIIEVGARTGGGAVQFGSAMLELRPRDAEKGRALAVLAAHEMDAWGDVAIVMLGDDLTDEGAFLVAEQHAGFGVLVATASRTSNARYRLTSPEDVVRFLSELGDLLR
jgi:trehalose-phosphatase